MSQVSGHALFAYALDEEILSLAFNRFWDPILAAIPIAGLSDFKKVVQSCIRSLYYYLSVSYGDVTLGMRATNMHWANKPSGHLPAVFALVLFVENTIAQAISFCQDKESKEQENTWRKRVFYALGRLLSLVKLASLLNYIVFIAEGKYSTLAHRMLCFQVGEAAQGQGQGQGQQGGQLLGPKPSQLFLESRKFAWAKILGLASILAVSIEWGAVRGGAAYLSQSLFSLSSTIRSYLSPFIPRGLIAHENGGEGGAEGGEKQSSRGEMQCVDCGTAPAENPYLMPCGHVSCYLCYQAPLRHTSSAASALSDSEDEYASESYCKACFATLGGKGRKAEPWGEEVGRESGRKLHSPP